MILQLIYFEHEFVLSYINYVYIYIAFVPPERSRTLSRYRYNSTLLKIKIAIKIDYIFRGPDTIIFSFRRSLPPKYFY
jgi:hypothetical protein